MILLMVLSGFTALFIGWTLGPAALSLAQKTKELPQKIKDSAKKSQEDAKNGNDFQLPYIAEYITPDYQENLQFAAQKREPFLLFISLILALLFNNRYFWGVLVVLFLIGWWKEVLQAIWELVKMLWGVIFIGSEEKKK